MQVWTQEYVYSLKGFFFFVSVEFYGADDGELCFWGVVQLVNNKVKYSSHDYLLLLPAGQCLQFAL